jgi:23S rRNA (adenine-N6)-dimethyltransferase
LCVLILERNGSVTSIHHRSVSYSQNYLTTPRLVDHLLDRSSIGSDDVVYEIGPGDGLITARLAQRCRRIVAVEIDPDLAGRLCRRFAGLPQVTIRNEDFLQTRLPMTAYKVFANIPFNITAAIVTKLITAPRPPDDSYLGLQKEAAQRFLGIPRESLYAVLMKPWFEPAIVYRFKRTDFAPAPNVDVVMLRLRKRGPPLVSGSDRQLFRDFVVYAFTAWQPSLGSTLKGILSGRQLQQIAGSVECDLDVTPTSLRFEQWLSLFYHFKNVAGVQAKQAILGSERRLRRQQAAIMKIHRTRTPARHSRR